MSAAEDIATALQGRHVGSAWIARCPAHNDQHPSLSIDETPEGKVLICCHTGCSQDRVIHALKARNLWPHSANYSSSILTTTPGHDTHHGDDLQRKSVDTRPTALDIWEAARPAQATLVETYLGSRGLPLPHQAHLRFHPHLFHHGSGRSWPAMVALVTQGSDSRPIGIHRTFLALDGLSKAPIEPQRMLLGPCRGGVVRLGPQGKVLMIGEGIETCLAAMAATGISAWAALSTSGLVSVDLPPADCDVVILADGDEAGEAAAVAAAELFRWTHRVKIARPPSGLDFNDLLLGKE